MLHSYHALVFKHIKFPSVCLQQEVLHFERSYSHLLEDENKNLTFESSSYALQTLEEKQFRMKETCASLLVVYVERGEKMC